MHIYVLLILTLLNGSLEDYLKNNGVEPVKYILNKFNTHQNVSIQVHNIHEEYDFILTLLPIIKEAGNINIKINIPRNTPYKEYNDILSVSTVSAASADTNKTLYITTSDMHTLNAFNITFHTALQDDLDKAYNNISCPVMGIDDISSIGGADTANTNGYIFLSSVKAYTPLTVIPELITHEYIETTFPNVHPETLEYMIDLCRSQDRTLFEQYIVITK